MSTSGEGWFADPQDGQRLRWWDGSAWTEHTHPLVGPHHGAPALKPSWFRLAVVLQVALGVSLLASAFTLYVDLETLAFVEEIRLRPDTVTLADAARIDSLTVWTTIEIVAYLATGVLFIVWLHTVHSSERMDRSVLEHGSGWAIGGWFVPVLSLWRPFQMVTDVRRGASGDHNASATLAQGWWWGMWVANSLLSIVVAALYDTASTAPDGPEYADALAQAASWERWCCLVGIIGAVLAVVVVRQVTRLVREPARTTAMT